MVPLGLRNMCAAAPVSVSADPLELEARDAEPGGSLDARRPVVRTQEMYRRYLEAAHEAADREAAGVHPGGGGGGVTLGSAEFRCFREACRNGPTRPTKPVKRPKPVKNPM